MINGYAHRWPNKFVGERKKDEDYYKKCTRAIISEWLNQQTLDNNRTVDNRYERYQKAFDYYYGEQGNFDYKFMEEVQPGVNAVATWLPGQKISSLVDYMEGTIINQIDSYNPTAKAVSPETSKKQRELKDKLMLQLELRNLFKDIEQKTGIPFQPVQGFEPQSAEDIEEFMQFSAKEQTELLCQRIVAKNLARNRYHERFTRTFVNAVIAGPGGIKVDVVNGKTEWNVIDPRYAIIDYSRDSNLNEKARFAGRWDMLSIEEVLERYNLTDKQIAKLKETAENDKDWQGLIGASQFPWWRKVGNTMMVRVVDVEFIDMKVLRYEERLDKYGNHHLGKYSSKRRQKLSGKEQKERNKNLHRFELNCVRKATLIGDCELVDWGEKPNQFRSRKNLADTQLSYHFWTPGIRNCKMRSIGERLFEHQDRIDLYRYKIQQALTRDLGRNFIYDISQLGEDSKAAVILELKNSGVVWYDSTADEQGMGNRPPSGKYIDVLDLSIDGKSVSAYLELIEREKYEMEEIVSIPRVAQGMQTSIIGKGVQENTIERSTIGTVRYYRSFIEFINKFLQYDANVCKTLVAEYKEEWESTLGEVLTDYAEITKQMAFEEFDVSININDIQQEKDKQEMMQLLFADVQNQKLSTLHYLEIKNRPTYQEKVNYLRKIERQQNEMRQMEQQRQEQAMLMAAQMKEEAGLQKTMIQQGNENQRTELKAQGALLQEGIKQQGNKRTEPAN